MDIVQHIKNKKGQRIGVLLASNVDKHIRIGWSKLKKGDKFNSALGLQIAHGRAAKYSPETIDFSTYIPTSFKAHFKRFISRSNLYFKDCVKI